jgi:2-hydroxychromene-2-carboxylate isomerase
MNHTRINPADLKSIDFHFDVMCPWAYQTSLWIREVRDQTGLEINWRFFSLEEINRVEGKKHPWERPWSYGWSMMRVGAVLRREDMDLLDRWYLRAGTALHVEGRKPHRQEVAEELMAELDLDPRFVQQALDDETTHDDVRAEHDKVVNQGFFGVPTMFFEDGQSLFGPVLIDPPKGEDAVRLWHHVVGWLEWPHMYEVQRPKGPEDMKAIAAAFQPYLEARDWNTIENPAP